jgi:hypothetical protein
MAYKPIEIDGEALTIMGVSFADEKSLAEQIIALSKEGVQLIKPEVEYIINSKLLSH